MTLPPSDGTTNKLIYLDYQSTTPCDPRVVSAMLPYFTEQFGNPHSRNHGFGHRAEEAVEMAREQVARAIGAKPRDVIFTSGATESNNLALKGVAKFYGMERNHLITCTTEHKCVLDTCRYLSRDGFDVTYLPVQRNGLIDLGALEAAITPKTLMVSIMLVNNEIGVIQPLADIAALCRARGIFLHTDAAQALGKIPIDVDALGVDLLSLSSHKIYGPKGVGALYVRRKPLEAGGRRLRLVPQMNGGGQERGLRSGTLSPALCVGFGLAADIAVKEMPAENERIRALRDRFMGRLNESLTDIILNGDAEQRVPNNLNVSFSCVEGEGLMMGIKHLALSSGSACTSSSLEPSYVLRALGIPADLIHTSLRIGFGRFTTPEEVDEAADAIIRTVTKLRDMSPLWEMTQQGIDISAINWAAH